jgi:hypothetical protein
MSIEVNDESGEGIDAERVAALARFVLDRLRVHPQAELSVLAVDVATMSSLHQQWMDEDGPTDVLSFPMDELRPGTDDEDPEPGLLGDVVLCPGGGRTAGRCSRAPDRPGARPADDPRHPAPARLRPRRAGRGARDVRLQTELLRGWAEAGQGSAGDDIPAVPRRPAGGDRGAPGRSRGRTLARLPHRR